MNRFRPRHGTGAPYTAHMLYIGDSMEQAFRDALADYIALSPHFFIAGGVLTSAPSGSSVDYAITDGSVCFGGEVMPVVASAVTKSPTQVVFLELVDEGVDDFPVLNIDGNTDMVMRSRYARLRVAAAYPDVFMPIDAPRKEALDLLRLKGRVVPKGGIVPYFGPIVELFDATGLGAAGTAMDGWAICNGLNGTVDLRGMTPFGATDVPASGADPVYGGVGGNSSPGDKVGADMQQIEANQLPAHVHGYQDTVITYDMGGPVGSGGSGYRHETAKVTSANSTSHNPLDMRQASFALVFIQSVV